MQSQDTLTGTAFVFPYPSGLPQMQESKGPGAHADEYLAESWPPPPAARALVELYYGGGGGMGSAGVRVTFQHIGHFSVGGTCLASYYKLLVFHLFPTWFPYCQMIVY